MIIVTNNINNKKPDKNSESYNNIIRKETGLTLTNVNHSKYNKEREVIDSAEPKVTLGFKVARSVHRAYHGLDRDTKWIVARAVEALVLSFARGEKNVLTPSGNFVFNINIVQNQNRVNAELTLDPVILQKENRVLRQEKKRLQEIVKFYEEELRKREADIKELERRLRVEREARARLVGYIRYALEHDKPELVREVLKKALEG